MDALASELWENVLDVCDGRETRAESLGFVETALPAPVQLHVRDGEIIWLALQSLWRDGRGSHVSRVVPSAVEEVHETDELSLRIHSIEQHEVADYALSIPSAREPRVL